MKGILKNSLSSLIILFATMCTDCLMLHGHKVLVPILRLIPRRSEVACSHSFLSPSDSFLRRCLRTCSYVIWPLNISTSSIGCYPVIFSIRDFQNGTKHTLVGGNVQHSDDVKNKPSNKEHQTGREGSVSDNLRPSENQALSS